MLIATMSLSQIACASEDSVDNENQNNGALVGAFPTSKAIKTIPRPPVGKRWIVNRLLSDEFNGTELDKTKWLDNHPTWKGREPGLFMESQVSVKDGNLVLEGGKMEKDTVFMYAGKDRTYNVKCAAVVSKEEWAYYGSYYECRVKANKTTLSTTFWLSKRSGAIPTEGRQPEGAAVGRFHQELDILECVGRTGNFDGKFFAEGMNSNVHYWFTPTGGTQQDIRAKETRLKLKDGTIPSEGYQTYGCWWRDKQSASFYLNNEQETHVDFEDRNTGKPFYFTEKMGLNLVLETYPFPWIELPNAEELEDDTKNKNYYDWVRVYDLVDLDQAEAPGAVYPMFEEHISINNKAAAVAMKNGTIVIDVDYTATKDCEIEFILCDASKKQILTKKRNVKAGYGVVGFECSDGDVVSGSKYHAIVYLRPVDSSDNSNAYEGDSFGFTCLKM